MTRTMTDAAKAAAQAEHVRVVALVEFGLRQPIRVCSAAGHINWNGHRWLGMGDLGAVGDVQEDGEVKAHSIQFKLTGLKSAWVTASLAEHCQGKSAKLWLALLNDNYVIIADPVLVWSGLLDTITGRFGKEAALTATAQSRLARWDRPSGWRFNAASQQADYAADKGLEFVEDLVEKEIRWGG